MTHRAKELLAELAKFALLLTLFILMFRWADFSVGQSVILGLLLVIGYGAYRSLMAKATADCTFTPFRVVVQPKFAELLIDYKLLKDADELDDLFKLWGKKDQVLISFTVLESRSRGWLIFSHAYNSFVSECDFEQDIEGLRFDGYPEQTISLIDPTSDRERLRSGRPLSFYFRLGSGGYQLGLKVPTEWWQRICAENHGVDFVKTEAKDDPRYGETTLIFARLPYAAFTPFLLPIGGIVTTDREYDAYDEAWKHADTKLAEFGWKKKQPDGWEEVQDPWTNVEHRYFTVRYIQV
jgi:hypothetical protein